MRVCSAISVWDMPWATDSHNTWRSFSCSSPMARAARAASAPHSMLPSAPALAPLKGSMVSRGQSSVGDYYPRTLSLTSVAGIGRLPQVSLPLAESGGVPVGLSLLAAHGRDAFILEVAQRV